LIVQRHNAVVPLAVISLETVLILLDELSQTALDGM
jgi:hypothetical protein